MFKKLLSIRLSATFLAAISGKSKNGKELCVSKKKIALFAFLYAFIAITFFALVFLLAFPLGTVLIANGGENLYFGLFMILSFTAVFILSVFETKSELFECKDNDLLFSMPIKPRDIMLSRIFAILFYNYLVEFIIMIPVIASYAILGGKPLGIPGGIYVFMTLPIVATSLSVGVGYLVHIISAKVARFRNVIVIILSMGFLLLYMFGYTALMENLDGIISDIDANFEIIAETYSAVGAIGSIALMNPIALLVYTAAGALLVTATVKVISINYIKAITNTAKTKRIEYKEKKLSRKNQLIALSKKEFARFLSSPIYILNGALGLIFEIVLAFMVAFGGENILQLGSASMSEDAIVIESITAILSPIVISGLLFCQAMTMISSAALSLEGKKLWILKSMPIKAKTVLLSKCVPHAVLGACASVIAGIAVSFGLDLNFIESILCILMLSASSLTFALLGIILNTLMPKFEFTNEAEVVKQSLATFLDMLASMLIAVLMCVASIALMPIMGVSLFMLTAIVVFVIFDAFMYCIIAGPISKKYEAL